MMPNSLDHRVSHDFGIDTSLVHEFPATGSSWDEMEEQAAYLKSSGSISLSASK